MWAFLELGRRALDHHSLDTVIFNALVVGAVNKLVQLI
jgi:hypothetical protein